MMAAATIPRKLLIVIGVALAWSALFTFNMAVFSQFNHSTYASWLFLPAALRVLAVLLFEEEAVIGLMLGAYLTLPHDPSSSLAHELLISIFSGLAPAIAIWFCRRSFPITPSLTGLRGIHIVTVSVVSAGANSVLLNLCMAIFGRLNDDIRQIAAVFVGDLTGTAIVLFVLSSVLALMWKRKTV